MPHPYSLRGVKSAAEANLHAESETKNAKQRFEMSSEPQMYFSRVLCGSGCLKQVKSQKYISSSSGIAQMKRSMIASHSGPSISAARL
jgi:hypothetical protein